jgi:hypothetical protein
MKIYAGVGHGFNGAVWDDALARMVAFFQKYLDAAEAHG